MAALRYIEADLETPPTNGQVLAYSSASETWLPATASSSGGLADGDYGDVTVSGSGTVISVDTQMSITSDASGLKLSGDEASPGNSQYYGTDSGGTKGFHSLPSGGSGLTYPLVFSVAAWGA